MKANAIAKKLLAQGIVPGTHHATIKKNIREINGHSPTRDEYEQVIKAMESGKEDTRPMVRKKKPVKARKPKAKNFTVIETGNDGDPTRLLIECSDPQEDRDGVSVCEKTRDIAIQDGFQVYRCRPCQERAVQLFRNKLARERRKKNKK